MLQVLHSAENDTMWLQKDLNLYLVNMFDTCLAARKLRLSKQKLSFLLEKVCGVKIKKDEKIQSYFDWRIR